MTAADALLRISTVDVYSTFGGTRNWTFVRVGTTEGLHGWGEASTELWEATVAAAVAELGARLLGADALASEPLWQRASRHGFWRGGIASLADTCRAAVAPHNPGGPVSTAASAHVAMAVPNFAILEFCPDEPRRSDIVRAPWSYDGGWLHVPDSPGLGVDLDIDAILDVPARETGVSHEAYGADGSVMDV